MATISIQPPVLDLSFYAGDGVAFKLICTDDAQVPVDVSGAVEAQIRVDRVLDDPPVDEFSSDLTDAAQGIILLSLTGAQTQGLSDHISSSKGKFTGMWDLQWIASGAQPRTLCQGKVECLIDVTR